MIVSCDKCQTKHKLNDAAVPDTGCRVKCQKCDHIFTVHKKSAEPEATPTNDVSGDGGCRIITICNQKGGVAKTSSCINLGASLMLQKKRVLLVDFDVQANMSMLLGLNQAKSFFEVIHSDEEDIKRFVVKTKQKFWVLPSNSKMALLAKTHLQDENFEYLLRNKLESIRPYFDYILIDTPPSGDFYTLNALLASSLAIIPTQCEYLSMNGVNHVASMIDVVKGKTKHDIDYRVLITMFNQENVAARAIYKKFKQTYQDKLFETVIEQDVKIQEAQIAHMPVLHYDKQSKAGLQYVKLSREVMNVA